MFHDPLDITGNIFLLCLILGKTDGVPQVDPGIGRTQGGRGFALDTRRAPLGCLQADAIVVKM
jgi:hypothetical protein